MWSWLFPTGGAVLEPFEDQEIVYAKDQPEYSPLRTLRGSGPYYPVYSRWGLTDEQRKMIADGADIFLELSTFNRPLQPIRMLVGDKLPAEIEDNFVAVAKSRRK